MNRIALFSLLFAALPISAHATDITVKPFVPVGCQQSATREVTWVQVQPGQTGNNVTFDVALSHGTCRLGQRTLAPIASDYDFYLIGQEYSRDFDSSYALNDAQTLGVHLKLTPTEFFQLTDARHFTLTFYPNSGAESFNFAVTISRDPATNVVSFELHSL